jgi:hypothetical protein
MSAKEMAEQFAKYREENPRRHTKMNEGKTIKLAIDKAPCECCGEVKRLHKNNNKMCCSVCEAVRGAVKYRPQSVIDIYREMQGAIVPVLNAVEIQDVVRVYCDQKPQLESDSVMVKTYHEEEVAELGKKVLALQKENEVQANTITELRLLVSENGQLTADNQGFVSRIIDLEKQVENMTKKYDRSIIEQTHLRAKLENCNGVDRSKLMLLALDLAQHHLNGNIMVSAECFKELRKVAVA